MDNWKVIPDTDYIASEDGRIARLKILSTRKNDGGYLEAEIHIGGKVKKRLVHRLVALAHIGPPPTPKHEINHRDGVKGNNAASNLAWVTPKENTRHALDVLHISRARGDQHWRSKITAAKVVAMREQAARGETYRDLAAASGLSEQQVGDICRGRQWVHAGGPISPPNRNEGGMNPRSSKLSATDRSVMAKLRRAGMSVAAIAQDYSVSPATVYKALRDYR